MKRKRRADGRAENLGDGGTDGYPFEIIIRAGSAAGSVVDIHRVEPAGKNPRHRLALGNGDRRRVKDIRGQSGPGATHSDKSRRSLTKRFARGAY